MIRRSLTLAILASLSLPAAAQAFFFRPFCYAPPPAYYYAPPVYYYAPPPAYYYAPPVFTLPPVYLPPYECAPAPAKPAPKLMDAPKPMEKPSPKTELPKPKEVVPAAASDKPNVEPAIPLVAVPDAPKSEKKPDAPKPELPVPAPLVLPPEKKPDEKKDAGVPAIPKLNLPLAVPEPAVPTPAVPKTDDKKIPEIKLPPIVSESKYLAREEPTVRVVPVEGKRGEGNRVVNFYNYTDRAFALSVDGQLKALPAKSSLALALPDSFLWSIAGKKEMTEIPADAAGLSVVIK
jgi:hypothetical protein